MGIKMLRIPGPGKNLCKVDNRTTGGSFTVKTEDNNVLKITGTGSSQWLIPSITHDAAATSLSVMKSQASGIKKFNAGQAYTIQVFGAVATITDLQLVSVDKTSNQSITLTNGKATFTPEWDVSDIYIRYNDATTITFNESLTIQIEEGSTATDYEPYQDYLYKPGVTNENDGTRAKVDMGTLTWTKRTDESFVYWASQSLPRVCAPNVTTFYCSSYRRAENTGSARLSSDKMIGGTGNSSGEIFIRDDAKANLTAAQFKEAMSGIYLYYQRTTDASWTDPFWAFLQGGNN